ncbi:MAG: response regulator [Acidobacteria bacterium]|nr:response regulator [Acidobacteriota bacterium]
MNKKVLTIDDSKTLRMIVGKHLLPFGVQMLQAENGEQGIERAREGSPDVILLDYNMPVMDGYHTLVELKTDPELKSIPVIMLTTETVKDTVMKLVKLGLKDYIAKPFTREILLDKLNPILGLYDSDGNIPPPSEKPAADKSSTAGEDSSKQTILAVDDKPNILEMLQDYLSEQFNILTADSGKSALNAIKHKKFDYLFLDLNMPDISGFDVLRGYLKGALNKASAERVVAMTLRTNQADIEKAMEAGVSVFLYKPFKRDEAIHTAGVLISHQKDGTVKKTRFLRSKGDIRILDCPPMKSSKYRTVALALKSDIMREIDDMAEDGFNKLVINVGDGFLSDLGVTRKFVDMVDHTLQLSLNVRLVADSDQARDALKQFEETANIPTEISLECALGAIR